MNKKNLLETGGPERTEYMDGALYWEGKSKAYSILRFPARLLKIIYPAISKSKKTHFEIICFSNKEQLENHIKKTKIPPILLNLYEIKQENEQNVENN